MTPDPVAPRPSEADSEIVTVAPAAALPEPLTIAPVPPIAAGSDGTAMLSIPDYDILGELGRGGMGVVYKARQIAADRLVALKMILSGGHAGSADLARFRREAQAVARLQHPGVVQVFEVGEHRGLPFFSLELVDGGSLDRKLNGTPLPAAEAVNLLERVAEAMHAAHCRHIIHRDLKPANILLTSDGEPKVTDFGLAKTLDVEQGHTATGAVMGTPSYMAPEQADGKSKEIGPATDVYALGAVLYECLTGRPPFKAATPLDTILQVLSEEPVSPRRLQPKVPRDLETICLKCLRKESSKRYASAAELAEDLRRFRNGEPIRARPVGAMERAAKWVKRRPALASLIAVVVLAMLSLLGGGAWFTVQLDQARRRAEESSRDALAQLDRAETALDVNQLTLAARETEYGNLFRSNVELNNCRSHNWEWHYLRRCNHYTVPQLSLGQIGGDSVAFSPDGCRLAHTEAVLSSPPLRSVVNVWDARTWVVVQVLGGHTSTLNSATFSPDGSRLAAAAGSDKTVKVWDTRTGLELLTLKGHTDLVRSVAFNSDGSRLASASDDGTVKVWEARTGATIHTLKGNAERVYSVAFSPDGSQLASGHSRQGVVTVWDARTGADLFVLKGHTGSVWSVAFSPDGNRLASAGGDQVKIWDARTGARLLTLKGHTSSVHSVAFSPDGQRIGSGSLDNTIKLWDAHTGTGLLTLGEPSRVRSGQRRQDGGWTGITSVAFSPDGSRLASTGFAKLKLWDARMGQEVLTLKGHKWGVDNVVFSPDSKRIITRGRERTVKEWDAHTGVEISSRLSDPDANVLFRPDGSRIDRRAESADGSRLASVSGDGTVKVWDGRSGAELFTLKEKGNFRINSMINSVAFSPDGSQLASTGMDDTVKLWDARTGDALLTLKGHEAHVTSLAFSTDGSRLASGSWDKTVKVWDTRTGFALLTLTGHRDKINRVVFSPDGSKLASASDDRSVKVWDARRTDIDDDSPAARVLRQQEDDWTTIAWHLQQADQAREDRDTFAQRFHLDYALADLRLQVHARLTDGDAPGCLHAGAILASVAGRDEDSLKQFQRVLARHPNPAADELLLAWAYHKRGQLTAARRWLQRAIVSKDERARNASSMLRQEVETLLKADKP